MLEGADSPQRIVVFRFHRDIFVCRNRLRLLRRFNPDTPIFGLFGGALTSRPVLARARTRPLARHLEDLYLLPGRSWADQDLAARHWFAERGHAVPFDVAHLIEWDVLLFGRIEDLYRRVAPTALGLTGLVPLQAISARWSWLTREQYRSELAELMAFLRAEYSFSGPPYACVGPGLSLPRSFLERYASVPVPELCHDELRLPTFASALGFELEDTGFFKRWFDQEEERFFNADRREIDEEVIRRELARPEGRRVFHPYFRVFRSAGESRSAGRRRGDREETVERVVVALVRLARKTFLTLRRPFIRDR